MATEEKRLETILFDMHLQSPFILGSGPLCHDANSLIAAHKNGAGAVVTKTLRANPAINPIPHICSVSKDKTLINAEKWSELPYQTWVDTEIPKACESGVIVIASIGHTPEEVQLIAPLVLQAGAKALELVSYDERTMLDMVCKARKLTDRPILAKLSPNWNAPETLALQLETKGVSGFTAMDSVGPVLRIDIHTRRPLVEGENGRGWLSGPAIKPIILHHIAELAFQTNLPIIGLGGIETAEDVIEMTMAGAQAIGLCSSLMTHGLDYLPLLIRRTLELLDLLGYATLAEIQGVFLSEIQKERPSYHFQFTQEKCIGCNLCNLACPYGAQYTGKSGFSLKKNLCHLCGLCGSVCPTKALSFLPTGAFL
ncbi:4Fe-4S binding protein [uncultured Sphaerochaeta sp.]|uniref:4Fe-4S binding protein n=1 Tax=uncultured Sphaerochaeta sp. TaxID=886478 RepID=UPI002A0A72DA|nr:4Fe-4S binding protein [uncultured Sphaerochaeta sp.]